MTPLARRTAAVLAGGLGALVASAAPALAVATPIGQNGTTLPQSTVTTVLLFIGVPLGTVLLVALFVLPQRAVGALRYRPGRSWAYSREWFGSRPDPLADPTQPTPGFPAGGTSANW